jgi:hypothetical protein
MRAALQPQNNPNVTIGGGGAILTAAAAAAITIVFHAQHQRPCRLVKAAKVKVFRLEEVGPIGATRRLNVHKFTAAAAGTATAAAGLVQQVVVMMQGIAAEMVVGVKAAGGGLCVMMELVVAEAQLLLRRGPTPEAALGGKDHHGVGGRTAEDGLQPLA